MDGRQLGQTDLLATALGIGLAALGRPGYITLGHGDDLPAGHDPDAMEAHAHAVLDRAWQAGIRYFDTARSYGRAEAYLATWLTSRRIAPATVTVGSKWGYTYTAGWAVELEEGRSHEVKEHSRALLQKQLAESRSLLGDHLDLYQIHSATLESGVLSNGAVLSALAQLRDSGLAIGFSVSGPNQAETIRRALAVEADKRPLFATVQATWNLLERSATAALQEAHAAGVGVLVKEALANGRLTDRNQAPGFRTQRALLDRIARDRGTTLDALALAAALSQPWTDTVLSGAATADHLSSNLGALEVAWDEELDERLAGLVETPQTYWALRGDLPWN